MKRAIPFIIITSIIIVSALRSCMNRDDDSYNEEKTKHEIETDGALRHRIDSFMTAQEHIGSMGLVVYDLTAQKTVYAYNEDTPMRPASCMKLLTCIAAMHKVGAGYKYKTRLYTSGEVIGDTLHGNIILKSQFDPSFNRDSLYNLLGALRERNIRSVKGCVILDMAFTEPMTHEQHWIMGDLKTSRLGTIYQGYKKMHTEMLYALHSAAGIAVNKDSIRFGRLVPQRAVLVAETVSPISIPIEKALKNSSNINAESLTYLLGYTITSGGGFRKNGKKALEKFISQELKMSPAKVCNIEDGCGLCPDNRMTPGLLISLLNYAYKHPAIYRTVAASLPLSGTDGTLHDRLRKPNVLGKIKAKTGTLTREGGISTLAGYFKGKDGHDMAFAIMNNECPVMDGRWWQDKFCEKALLPQ